MSRSKEDQAHITKLTDRVRNQRWELEKQNAVAVERKNTIENLMEILISITGMTKQDALRIAFGAGENLYINRLKSENEELKAQQVATEEKVCEAQAAHIESVAECERMMADVRTARDFIDAMVKALGLTPGIEEHLVLEKIKALRGATIGVSDPQQVEIAIKIDTLGKDIDVLKHAIRNMNARTRRYG